MKRPSLNHKIQNFITFHGTSRIIIYIIYYKNWELLYVIKLIELLKNYTKNDDCNFSLKSHLQWGKYQI